MANTANDAGRARTLMDETGIAKPVTCDGAKLRARPMAAFIERNDTAICMLTDARRHTDEEIAQHPDINLSFADTGGRKYVAVTGAATVGNDGINRKVAILMGIEPTEVPPATPGRPVEPPREDPPGRPQPGPDVPPPMHEPEPPAPPQELPGNRPDELPPRTPQAPPSQPPATDTRTTRCALAIRGLNAA